MKHLGIAAALAVSLAAATAAQAENTVRVGWCARTVSAAATPFAVASARAMMTPAEAIEVTPIFLPFRSANDLIGDSSGTAMP